MSTDTPNSSETITQQVKEALFEGRKIEAIRLVREGTEMGLKEAKEFVERAERQLRAESPEKFAAAKPGKGCLGVVIGLVLGGLACAAFALRGN